ncbi:MAG: transglutaminase family protein [Magnetospiraceae bacterium]
MKITIDHATTYRYEEPVNYSIQSLRLSPQPFDGQFIRYWNVESDFGQLPLGFFDSFGNLTHTLVVDRPHESLTISVRGEVETSNRDGVVTGSIETFATNFYLRETELTEIDGALRGLGRAAQSGATSPLNCLHRLMEGVREAIDYKTGETHSMTTAAQALAHGFGVCQDHAHAFIAAARSIDIPARYVSGYLLSGEEEVLSEAAHAWAEAYVPDLGWVGFDVANMICPTEYYVRIGVGLDYREAAPIRGVRRGGGDEDMEVVVKVARAGGSAQ